MSDPSGARRQIEDLLHRRNDLSTFLVHLTRTARLQTARARLLEILSVSVLRAGEPMGMASGSSFPPEVRETQRVVCFTETPLEHVWMLTERIEGRSIALEPYGVVFTKTWARRNGVNPVWYVDITVGHEWLTNPISRMLETVRSGSSQKRNRLTGSWELEELEGHPLTVLTPFIEQMGNPSGTRKEFWWEREWRHVGDLGFSWPALMAVFAPENDHEQFLDDLRNRLRERGLATDFPFRLLDPRWGLERMLGSLAGVSERDLGPFPQ